MLNLKQMYTFPILLRMEFIVAMITEWGVIITKRGCSAQRCRKVFLFYCGRG